jgi:hypothetical protein
MTHVRVFYTALLLVPLSGAVALHAQGDKGKQPNQQARQAPQKPVPAQEQKGRVQQEQQRTTQYNQHLGQQVQVVQRQTAQLQQQNRVAQVRTQQAYTAQLQKQQQQLQVQRNYANDPYISTPATYRYTVSGTSHQTNQYGADVLRAAVNNGYQQGVRAGEADHQDRSRSNYQGSAAYQDANYGYAGNYVDRADYNYYFRQGFQRGYPDGYNSSTQYGSNSNILGNLLTSILGLVSIH